MFKTAENMTSFKCKANKKNTDNNELTFDCVKNKTIFDSLNNIFTKYNYNAYKEYKKQHNKNNTQRKEFGDLLSR